MTVQDVEMLDASESGNIAVPERFAVTDEESANWVCRKITEARLYADRVREWAEREVRRAVNEEAWLTQRYGPQLELWVSHELSSRGSRARSLKLPGGQLGFRTTPSSVQTVEANATSAWCQEHLPEAFRIRVNARGRAASTLRRLIADYNLDATVEDGVISAEIKKHVESTGELPPGTLMSSGVEQFYIR